MPMPEKFDPSTSALVLIDLQLGITAMPATPHDSAAVVKKAASLAAAFRARRRPVVLVHVANSPDGADALKADVDQPLMPPGFKPAADWAEFRPELKQSDADLVITKHQWGAFYGTELDLQLRRRGVRTIVLAGIATNIGVESTARDALERGYNQIFVEDAMSSLFPGGHEWAVKHILPRMGRVVSTADVLAAI
jgi:nicotinamidase-related amidase